MPRLTQDEKDEITAAMVGVIDRYCGMDPVDMPLARELSAECCRLIEARERGVVTLPVQLPPIYAIAPLVAANSAAPEGGAS
ncbi:MAG: hypothetical protein MEQ74_03800 [Paracoccus sp.]|nr:hypothetical protein [Paracoccus sp. (in: a-proteobacteria)]